MTLLELIDRQRETEAAEMAEAVALARAAMADTKSDDVVRLRAQVAEQAPALDELTIDMAVDTVVRSDPR